MFPQIVYVVNSHTRGLSETISNFYIEDIAERLDQPVFRVKARVSYIGHWHTIESVSREREISNIWIVAE